MKLQRIKTADGSSTLLHESLGETYHSAKGALSESLHVYIEAGLQFLQAQKPHTPLHILEVGYGTGMNALLTLANARQPIYYTGLEPFPIAEEELITCAEFLQGQPDRGQEQIARLPWKSDSGFKQISSGFFLRKIPLPLMVYQTDIQADLVYFDAFAPKFQPELWQEAAWNHLKQQVKPGAVVVTYCAQGAFRRMLKENQWQVEKRPGPPGHKREMTRVFAAVL